MIIQPIPILPIIPINPFIQVTGNIAPDVLVNVLAAVVFIGIAVFLGWKFTQVLLKRNYKSNLVVNLVLSGVVALALFLRFGTSVAILQGLRGRISQVMKYRIGYGCACFPLLL